MPPVGSRGRAPIMGSRCLCPETESFLLHKYRVANFCISPEVLLKYSTWILMQ